MRTTLLSASLSVLVLVGCETDYHCAPYVYSPEEHRCVCPPGTVLNDGGVGCRSLDAGPGDAGECVPTGPELCNGVDDDCDGTIDGPAASTACGTADHAASLACTSGACEVSACSGGFADCDGEVANGCEATLGTLDHCGACGDTCAWSCAVDHCDDAIDLDAYRDHICLVRESGRVYCWGNNDRGQLGIGTTGGSAATPQLVVGPSGTGALEDVIDISVGQTSTCAVVSDGTVWCWGSNTRGELGTGGTVDSDRPVVASGLADARQVSVGGSHACAVTDSAELWCWGRNPENAQARDEDRPRRVMALANIAQVECGYAHTCVRREDGEVRCFGQQGVWGSLGDGNGYDDSFVPVAPAGLPRATDLAAGSGFTCVVTEMGELWCWGNNSSGQFGAPGYGAYPTPTEVDVSGTPVGVFAGRTGICVTFASGRPQCFGPGGPVLEAASRFALAETGDSCAIVRGGAVDCWSAGTTGPAMPLAPPE